MGLPKFQSNLSSTFILDGYQTGPWAFQNNAVKGYDTLTFGNMKLKGRIPLRIKIISNQK